MAQVVTRLYDSNSKLSAIQQDLKSGGYTCTVVTGYQSGRSTPLDDIVEALRNASVPRAEAAAYAEYVKNGATAVAVPAKFGDGTKVAAILDSYGPKQISLKSSAGGVEFSDATPFSNILHAPVLLKTSGPYKSYSGDLLLVDSNKTFSGTPLVISSDGPYQSFSGTPLLLDSSGPYKSFSGTPLLLDTSGPYKSYSGEPLLINNPTPFSSWLGLPVLSK